MEQNAQSRVLNIGCGLKKLIGAVNVDAWDVCKPDIVWDLNKVPWPWAEDNSFDTIYAYHVMEHLPNWWEVFKECARVLKVGGILEIRVPDESSYSALSYRDHHHVFTPYSFHGVIDGNDIVAWRSNTNAWALGEEYSVPFKAKFYAQVPHKKYNWMLRWPFKKLLAFMALHMRNFIWEQVIVFEKVDINLYKNTKKTQEREQWVCRNNTNPLQNLG
jgi:SAM-dependent methyltransferase